MANIVVHLSVETRNPGGKRWKYSTDSAIVGQVSLSEIAELGQDGLRALAKAKAAELEKDGALWRQTMRDWQLSF